jgi:hypothetical protein
VVTAGVRRAAEDEQLDLLRNETSKQKLLMEKFVAFNAKLKHKVVGALWNEKI